MSHTFTPKIFVEVPKCPRFWDIYGDQNINPKILTKGAYCYDKQLFYAEYGVLFIRFRVDITRNLVIIGCTKILGPRSCSSEVQTSSVLLTVD